MGILHSTQEVKPLNHPNSSKIKKKDFLSDSAKLF